MGKQKRPLARTDWPQVSEQIDSRTKKSYWMVDGRAKKMGRRSFSAKKEALAHAVEMAKQVNKFGSQPEVPNDLKRQADSYVKLCKRLVTFGSLPEDAVTHYIEWRGQQALQAIKPTIGELIEQFKEHKLLKAESDAYENQISVHTKFIKATWGTRKIDDLKKNEIDATLTKKHPNKGTRKHYLTFLKMFFYWAIAEGKDYLVTNPTDGIVYKPKKFEKQILTAEQAKSLFNIVKEVAPELMGYYAALTFVGLRPTEGCHTDPDKKHVRIYWTDIKFESKQLRVTDDTKTGHRYCLLEPVALAWFKYHHAKCNFGQKPFIPEKSLVRPKMDYNVFNIEKEVRAAFKAKHDGYWPSDVLRHTFATHYVSLVEDEPKTAFYMGNSVAQIKKHYAQRLPKSELDEFWGMTPEVAFK